MFYDSDHVWHVAKTGNDSNGGHAQQYPISLVNDAKLTISATVTAAASGDTIIIWPGTYTEQVDLLAAEKAISLIGTHRYMCKITQAGATTTVLMYGTGPPPFTDLRKGSALQNLTIEQTGTGKAVDAAEQHNCEFINCDIISSGIDGLYCDSANNCVVEHCFIYCAYDSLYLGDGALVNRCLIVTDGTYTGSGIARALALGGTTAAVIKDSIIIASPPWRRQIGFGKELYESDRDLYCINNGKDVVLENCVLIADGYTPTGAHDDSYHDADAYVVALVQNLHAKNCLFRAYTDQNKSKTAYGISVVTRAVLENCTFDTVGQAATYDLYSASATTAKLLNCHYDSAKVHANVTVHAVGDTNGRVEVGTIIALQTTIASVTTADTVFVLAAGATDDDAFNNMIISVKDVSSGDIRSRRVTDYAQATKTITVDYDFEFPLAAGDIVTIFANSYSQTAGAAAVAEIASAVWDETQAAHIAQGTTGQRLQHSGRGRY